MATSSSTLRTLSSLAEYQACTELQEEVWGRGFSERVSAATLMIANRLGGLTAGAFDDGGHLQGFVFGLTGLMDGELVHWSDMLAVVPEARDQGLGTRLKHYQRDVLLSRGIRRMHWTFDPLQGRNAHVNFSKLGVESREYVQDMYGETDSPLHRGVGTDRLVAVWEMDSERVRKRLAGEEKYPDPEEVRSLPRALAVEEEGGFPSPGNPMLDHSEDRILLNVPGDLDAIMEYNLPLAVRWREATRGPFVHYLTRGYEVREFVRAGGVSGYVLVHSRVQGAEVVEGGEMGGDEELEGGSSP
jgi:chorismate synthase